MVGQSGVRWQTLDPIPSILRYSAFCTCSLMRSIAPLISTM